MADMYNTIYNPDVLSCIANLSNDEVFTPPEIANAMLDMLPQEMFADPKTTFLDPACKSGVFLREIAKRLMDAQLPDWHEHKKAIDDKQRVGTALTADDEAFLAKLQATVDHIFKEQVFGIAITELTSLLSRRSLYCSKYPNSKYSVTQFDDVQGNIRFKNTPHRWANGKCVFCGASESEYGGKKREGLETYAYELIHTVQPKEIWKMKFDVIVSNPPYQLSDGGNGKSAKPIYQLFVEQAKKLNPQYMTMIIPSRWFAGGKGLEEFRNTMLSDRRISKLVDYENFKDVFPGVDLAGGACYFLWDQNYNGMCEVTNYDRNNPVTSTRYLNEYEIFIRQNLAVEIVKKVHAQEKHFLDERVSSRKPFGLPTNYEPHESGVPCWFIQRIGLKYANIKDVDNSRLFFRNISSAFPIPIVENIRFIVA